MSIAFFVVLLDTSIVNVALVRLQRELGASLQGLEWVVDVYALTFASLLLSGGALTDKLGARRLFIIGLGGFTLASLLCSAAPDLYWLLVGRVLQGVGAALLLPASLALLRRAYPDPTLRARAVGLWIAAGSVANAAGPSVGGMMLAAFSWRAIFLVNLPIGLIGIALTVRWVRSPQSNPEHGLDPLGQLLGIVALVAMTLAIIEGGTLGWSSAIILSGFGLATASAVGFIAVEARGRRPMLPLGLFHRLDFSAVSIIAVLHNFGIYGQLFVLSLFLQNVRGFDPLATGLAFLPLTGAMAIAAVLSGRWVPRSGANRPMNAGHTLAAIGSAGLAWAACRGASFAAICPFLVAVGAGAGFASPPMSTAMLAAVPSERAGLAGGVLNTCRQIGNVIGVAALGAIVGAYGAHVCVGYRLAWIAASALLAINVVVGSIASRASGP